MVFFVAITGGPSSGKKEVCGVIIDGLKNGLVDHSQKVAVIKMETFYKTLTEAEEALLRADKYNFDHPTAIDFDMLSQTLDSVERGETVALANYDFFTHKRLEDTFEVVSPDVVILVGTLALYDARVRSHFNLKIFVDVDSDLRLARQVVRDTEQRYTKPLEAVLDQYLNFVKPSFEDFILPTKKYADVVIPRGINNKVAIKLMATHLVDILKANKGGQAPLSVEQAV